MYGLTVKRRQEPLGWSSCLFLLTAVLLACCISAVLLVLQGKPPLSAMVLLFKGAFGSRWALEDSLVKAIPIFLCSLGVAIAFRLQIWNIGAEGQFALGTIGATWVALSFSHLPKSILLPLMTLTALAGGGVSGDWFPLC